MPLLKQVLPEAFVEGADPGSPAHGLQDMPVVAVKLATGSPCSSHAEMFGDWPGPQAHVSKWFVLENGQAVGINEDPDEGWSFPVVDYES